MILIPAHLTGLDTTAIVTAFVLGLALGAAIVLQHLPRRAKK